MYVDWRSWGSLSLFDRRVNVDAGSSSDVGSETHGAIILVTYNITGDHLILTENTRQPTLRDSEIRFDRSQPCRHMCEDYFAEFTHIVGIWLATLNYLSCRFV